MKFSWSDFLQMILSSALLTGLITLLAKKMDWIRFTKKDKVQVDKTEAEIRSIGISDQIRISDEALKWTLKFAEELSKANEVNDRRQRESERLLAVIAAMKVEFDKQMDEIKELLFESRKECDDQRAKYQLVLYQLNEFLKNGTSNGAAKSNPAAGDKIS